MTGQAVPEYGPYTLDDLDALPEDGRRYELADGWLSEVAHSPWHDNAASRLRSILKAAARSAGVDAHVEAGPSDVATPAGVRKPDVFVLPADAARDALSGNARTFSGSDLLLVAEVVSPRSGSERTDRVAKVREYAQAGIPAYWIVELDPAPKVTALSLDGDSYAVCAHARSGQELAVGEPFPVSFDPGTLNQLERG